MHNKPLGRVDINVVDNIWGGSIDTHMHPGPDLLTERPVDSIQAVQVVKRSKIGGIALKNFSYNTVSDAYLIEENLTFGLRMFGGVVIGCTATDGLSHVSETVEAMAKTGYEVVWFLAMNSKWCRSYPGKERGTSILKKDGILEDGVPDILELVKQYDMVVCSDHMFYEESTKMFNAAIQKGITKMVVIHPLAELSRFTLDQIQELAVKGVYIERVYGTLMPRLEGTNSSDYADCIELAGADRYTMGTDLVQVWDMMPADGMRHFIVMMVQFGYIPVEVEAISKKNPAKLLGMEEGQEEQ